MTYSLYNYMTMVSIVLVLFFTSVSHVNGIPLESNDLEKLKWVKHREHVLYETYTQTDKGLASVLGYQFDMFFNQNTCFILAISGAVEGNRGGYGFAAFGLGKTIPIHKKWLWDTRLLAGSGGGGGLDAGGGLMLEFETGLMYKVTNSVSIDMRYGYLKYLTGTFESPIFNLGVSFSHNSLVLPF